MFLGSTERTWSAPWSPLGTILVTMLISWGFLWRSRGCLGMPNFDNLDVQIKKIGIILASHARLLFYFYTYRLPLSNAPLSSANLLDHSVAHLIFTSR